MTTMVASGVQRAVCSSRPPRAALLMSPEWIEWQYPLAGSVDDGLPALQGAGDVEIADRVSPHEQSAWGTRKYWSESYWTVVCLDKSRFRDGHRTRGVLVGLGTVCVRERLDTRSPMIGRLLASVFSPMKGCECAVRRFPTSSNSGPRISEDTRVNASTLALSQTGQSKPDLKVLRLRQRTLPYQQKDRQVHRHPGAIPLEFGVGPAGRLRQHRTPNWFSPRQQAKAAPGISWHPSM